MTLSLRYIVAENTRLKIKLKELREIYDRLRTRHTEIEKENERLRKDRALLRDELEAARAWTDAVPVCNKHTSELVMMSGCVVCAALEGK